MQKKCTKCNETKDVCEFRVRNKAKEKYSCWCKQCFGEYERDKWKNDESRRTASRDKAKLRRIRNRKFLRDYLSDKCCCKCGEDDPVVLGFDHLDREHKKTDVSTLVICGWSIETIKEEISKCRILCANCHLRHTAMQMGWYQEVE